MSTLALKEKFNSLTLESENHWDYRGNNNSERDYVHDFCTYPAMMVPKMQREMLDVCLAHLQGTSIRLLDPFAGSGTILVEGSPNTCKKKSHQKVRNFECSVKANK